MRNGILGIVISLCVMAYATDEPRTAEKPAARAIKPSEVSLKVLKVAELLDAVKKHNGKVVVVYLWAEYDLVAKHHFPRVVAMHEKYRRQGLVMMSASIYASDQKDMERQRKLLGDNGAGFDNFILDEDFETLSEQLRICAEPAFVVFDRNGKIIARLQAGEEEQALAAAEKLVAKLFSAPSGR